MRSSPLSFAILGLGFVVHFWLPSAWAAPNLAETMLEEAFDSYCNDLDSKPPLCKKEESLGQKYLVLEKVCVLPQEALTDEWKPAKLKQECEPKPTEACKLFLCAHHVKDGETLPPLVIALDHETGRWEGQNRLRNAGKGRIEFDVAGQPTVSLTDDERIVVVVESTNPLLYSAIPGKPTEVDVPELVEFQKLLTAFGGGLSALSGVLASPEMVESAAAVPGYDESVRAAVKRFSSALLDVQCRTGQTEIQTGRAIAFVQSLELDGSGEYVYKPLVPASCTSGCSEPCPADDPDCAPRCEQLDSLKAADVQDAFSRLQRATLSPQDRPEDCVAMLDAAVAVIDADMKDPAKVRAAYRAYQSAPKGACLEEAGLRQKLDGVLQRIDVTSSEALKLKAAVDSDANELKRLEGLTNLTSEEKETLERMRDDRASAPVKLREMRDALEAQVDEVSDLVRLARLGKQLAELRKQGEGILAKRIEVEKAASQIEVFENRIERFRIASRETCADGPCVKASALDPRIILEPQLKKVRATKIQNHTLKVKTDSAYHDKVVATRPAELESAYNLDSVLRGLWGISASMIYTELANPTFGAVSSEDNPMQLVIAQTDEETRAGDIALLADFRLARWLACRGAYSPGCSDRWNWLGVELGAGLGDDPAFFGGLSFRLPRSRSWRLGVGWTYQQVNELAGGQKPGDPVASADDIKTRDDFDGDLYVSLSFALDSLKLFSAGGEE